MFELGGIFEKFSREEFQMLKISKSQPSKRAGPGSDTTLQRRLVTMYVLPISNEREFEFLLMFLLISDTFEGFGGNF